MLKKLWIDYKSITSGTCIKNFPEIDETLTSTDILTIAEVLRSSIIAFLTPEEREEHDKTFGFTSRSKK